VGEAAAAILAVAQEEKADLIVMGTHGRRGLGRLLMGSVAEKVMRNASTPVLSVKTAD
jgi:nucleotide-binding universal stress UspA family protein